uniref:Uncharacterized protein n=1 Tax=Oryza rufipogon TaxID=4529 RepID=A0A0E0NZE8_ORYRU
MDVAAARPSWSSPPSLAGSGRPRPDPSPPCRMAAGRQSGYVWALHGSAGSGERGGGSLAASLLFGRGLLLPVVDLVTHGRRCADVELVGRRLVLA